jgi:hypothetical protein
MTAMATKKVGKGPTRGERAGVASRNDLALAHGITAHRDGRLLADELDRIETVEICREIVMNSHRWVFEKPSRRITSQFEVTPSPGPAASEEVGPVRDGKREGVRMRTFRSSRWMKRSGPSPWPVAPWWTPDLS